MQYVRMRESNRRKGIGRVEVIACLGVTVLILTVVAASILSARAAARKLTCMCHIRMIGLAVQNYASGSGGVALPLLTSELKIKNDLVEGTMAMSWPIVLLPALDSTSILKSIKNNAVARVDEATGATLAIADADKISLEFLTCPEDPNSFQKPGKLSYVINAGFMPRDLYHGDPKGLHRLGLLSWDGNETLDDLEDIQVSAATGVTWRQNDAFQPSLDHISTGDGTSTTIMLIENLQAGHWYDTDSARIGFALPVEAKDGQVPFGTGNVFESVKHPLNTEFQGGTLATARPLDWQINSDRKAPEGTRPRPSSIHGGGVNAIMCDGSGRFISETIDPHVYVKLLTSNGVTYGEKEIKRDSY